MLANAGKVSAELGKENAGREFTEYRRVKDHTMESDFDRAIQQLPPVSTVASGWTIISSESTI